MTNHIFTFTLGMLLGIVFQNDIPLIKDIDHRGVRSHLVGILNSLTGG